MGKRDKPTNHTSTNSIDNKPQYCTSQTKSNKVMKTITPFLLSLIITFGFISCGSDDDTPDIDKTKKVTIEIDCSDNVLINHVVIHSDGELQTFSSLSVKTWSKEITYKGVAAVAVSASPTDKQPGTLRTRLIQDGKVVKESKAEGDYLSCNVTY